MADQTKHEFTILVNNQEFKTSAHELTGIRNPSLVMDLEQDSFCS